jgi:hypothetical protein
VKGWATVEALSVFIHMNSNINRVILGFIALLTICISFDAKNSKNVPRPHYHNNLDCISDLQCSLTLQCSLNGPSASTNV